MMKRIVVTGGAGFIGAELIRQLLQTPATAVLNIDNLGHASDLSRLSEVAAHSSYQFAKLDIVDGHSLRHVFDDFRPTAIMHLAAESHVDRSIESARPFINSNIIGTYEILETTRNYLATTGAPLANSFRLLNVSTDEVFGDIKTGAPATTEDAPFITSSPYSASKAAAVHLVQAWQRTYGIPAITTYCSNNYGPWQHPEKLIPTVIAMALNGQPIPVYGDGTQQRDWLHVADHAQALISVLARGQVGTAINISAEHCCTNLQLIEQICQELDNLSPATRPPGGHRTLITHVADRPGHDRRYALSAQKLRQTLGWTPHIEFSTGIAQTVSWYLQHRPWWQPMVEQRMSV